MTKKIHRLVAETFLSNPNNLPIVNHKNENRQDNFVDNLEWCSALYNNNYGNRNAKISNKLEAQRGRAIYKCDMDWNIIEQFPSITKAAQSVLGDVSSISKAARGKRTTYTLYGYNWIIASDYDNIKGGGADV